MVKHTQTLCRQQPTNCLSEFDHFFGLVLKKLSVSNLFRKKAEMAVVRCPREMTVVESFETYTMVFPRSFWLGQLLVKLKAFKHQSFSLKLHQKFSKCFEKSYISK